MLLSDLGRDGQEELLGRGVDLKADVVVAGLPDRGEPLSDALLEAVEPRLIIVADSEFPATRRAPWGLRERLRRHGIPVVYGREAGAMTLVIGTRGLRIESRSGAIPRLANPL